MRSVRGYLFILGATLFWGVSATVAKVLFTRQVDTLILVQMRMTLSCIVLMAYFLLFKRHLLRVRAGDLYRFALLGITGMAGSNFTYYFTIRETNVATAILLQYMAPLLVLGYAAASGDESLGFRKIAAGVVSFVGCFLVVAGPDFSSFTLSRTGLLSGVCSAFCWAFTNVWLRRLLKRYNVWTCLVYAFTFASIFWIVINPPWKFMSAGYPPELWRVFFGFAMISILIPHSFYFSGIRYLTASQAVITATFEPVVAIVSAFIILGEDLTPVQIAGAVVVLIGVALLQLGQPRREDLVEATPLTVPGSGGSGGPGAQGG
jgi:drug/metabolite transporter (DMT)-like permease